MPVNYSEQQPVASICTSSAVPSSAGTDSSTVEAVCVCPDISLESETENANTRYTEQKIDEVEKWDELMEKILLIKIESGSPFSSVCILCGETVDKPIVCADCHSEFVCCSECEVKHHRRLLHKPNIWNVSQNFVKIME